MKQLITLIIIIIKNSFTLFSTLIIFLYKHKNFKGHYKLSFNFYDKKITMGDHWWSQSEVNHWVMGQLKNQRPRERILKLYHVITLLQPICVSIK